MDKTSDPISYTDYNHLDKKKLSEVRSKAKLGDEDSCIKLYRHYYIGKLDLPEGKRWLKKGADFGSEKCQVYYDALPNPKR